jgi:hypothetical protein
MTEKAKKWMDENYRFIMLMGMGIEITLIAVIVVVDIALLVKH